MIPGENFNLSPRFVETSYKFFKAGSAGTSQLGGTADDDVTLKYCNNIGMYDLLIFKDVYEKISSTSQPTLKNNQYVFSRTSYVQFSKSIICQSNVAANFGKKTSQNQVIIILEVLVDFDDK